MTRAATTHVRRRSASSPRARDHGFTLIEIMIALMIFALLSAIAYRGLEAVLNARARVEQEARKWRGLALAFINIQQSLASVVDRSIRGSDGLIAPPFSGVAGVRHEEEAALVFTRTGFPDHGGVLADLQRVGYRVNGGRLEQLIWPVLDQAPATEPHAMTLVQGVKAMNARYLGPDGAWGASWPPAGDSAPAPAAVELELQLVTGETVTRVFALP